MYLSMTFLLIKLCGAIGYVDLRTHGLLYMAMSSAVPHNNAFTFTFYYTFGSTAVAIQWKLVGDLCMGYLTQPVTSSSL